MSNEPMSDEEFLGHVRDLRDRLLAKAAGMREMGIEVDEFLTACERTIASREGRSEEWVDMGEFMEKMQAFHREMDEFNHIQKQAERASAVGAIPGMLDLLEKFAQRFRNSKDQRVGAEMEASVAAARERLARGETPLDELMDLQLTLTAQAAEVQRRTRLRTAYTALFWESRPPEWWAKLPPAEHAKITESVKQWRAEREKLLGELPIEDRRRLEALRPEDFDKPDGFKI